MQKLVFPQTFLDICFMQNSILNINNVVVGLSPKRKA